MTVMMPKGTSSILMPELSITTSGRAVAFKVVSFVVIVTVINVLEVILSLLAGLVERKGIVEVVAVVEKMLIVVFVPFAAMVERSCFSRSVCLHCRCGCCDAAQSQVCVMVLVWGLLEHRRCFGRMICKVCNSKRKSYFIYTFFHGIKIN